MTHEGVTATDVGRVAVLAGGHSAERSISLKSGNAVTDALLGRGVDAELFDPAVVELQDLRTFDRAFIALHGRGGEDGVIQGALEALGVPYTGSGVLGSAIGMDKRRTKLVWRGSDLPTPGFARLASESDLAGAVASVGLPLMIKPSHEGSSLGMTRVDDESQLASAWQQARAYDRAVIAERLIEGDEYTVAILSGQPLPSIRIESTRRFYDFEAKYEADDTRMHCPSGLPDADEQALGALAANAFEAVGGSGWGRVDFMRDRHGGWWLLEINTVPGMTDHSLVPAAAAAAGIAMDELVWRILLTSVVAGGEGP